MKALWSFDEYFVLPQHFQQAFLYKDANDEKWLHVVHANRQGRHVFNSENVDIHDEETS